MESLTSHESPTIDGPDLVAIVLSVLAPGLGHILLGQVMKGIVIMALVIGSCGVGYIVSAIVALDAFMVARARHVRSVGDWETFPEYRTALSL
jgi:TM2 domain-containing membrane protein YozV